MWAIVDPLAPEETRTFWSIGTGSPMPEAPTLTYIATIQYARGALIFHLFEEESHGKR